jgi:hypothetical protein
MSALDVDLVMPDVQVQRMTPKQQRVAEKCVAQLKTLPFSVAMVVMANLLVSSCQMMGVDKRVLLELVEKVWESMLQLRKPEAQG